MTDFEHEALERLRRLLRESRSLLNSAKALLRYRLETKELSGDSEDHTKAIAPSIREVKNLFEVGKEGQSESFAGQSGISENPATGTYPTAERGSVGKKLWLLVLLLC